MTAAIIGLLCAVLPLVIRWIERRWAKDTPQARHDATIATIHSEVATGDAGAVNARIEHALDRLQDQGGSHTERPGSGQT